MIATELDPVSQRYLGAAHLPTGIEATGVVPPDAIMFDADTSAVAVAVDADLAIMMNVAVIHATAGSDPDPTTAVQLHHAIFDNPSRSLMSVDRTALRGLPYFSTVRLRIDTSGATTSNANIVAVTSTLWFVGSSTM
jgi:hypothetical protein